MGETLPEIMTPAFCHVEEATPDSTGYRFPVVGQQFWLHRAVREADKKSSWKPFSVLSCHKNSEALNLQAVMTWLTLLYSKI